MLVRAFLPPSVATILCNDEMNILPRLCSEPFARGRMKKVFQVSDIVRCILRRRDQIAQRVQVYKEAVLEVSPPPPPPPQDDSSGSSSSTERDPRVDAAEEASVSEAVFNSWPEVDRKIVHLRTCWEAYAMAKLSFDW